MARLLRDFRGLMLIAVAFAASRVPALADIAPPLRHAVSTSQLPPAWLVVAIVFTLFLLLVFGLSKFVRNNARTDAIFRAEEGTSGITPIPGDEPPHHHHFFH